jgi:RimJ/RimL family protein N-acetyltransferase
VRRETARPLLRPVGPEDLEDRCTLNGDPQVMRFILDGATLDRAQTAGRLAAMQAHWAQHGFGLFALRRRGRGIATEAAEAVLDFAFEEVGPTRLLSIRHVDNDASGRVMEKLGFRFERQTVVPEHGPPVSVWALSAEEHRARAGEAASRRGRRGRRS